MASPSILLREERGIPGRHQSVGATQFRDKRWTDEAENPGAAMNDVPEPPLPKPQQPIPGHPARMNRRPDHGAIGHAVAIAFARVTGGKPIL
ncbi:MAG: hypothetical protein WB697_08980 [Stellaceae bacterium]